ncbi:MAG: class I SAM-dependent methyltransferase [Armatimonadetes bacterium]|nr:class I SAM-dependent methyltransferase [Armatimonadota bacterium]
MLESPICNICQSVASNVLITKNGFDVYRCPDCGLAFTHPQPQQLSEQYDSSYFDIYRRRRAFRLKRGDRRLRKIELLKEPGRLLDIGCSLGYFVEAANARAWQASGIEISPHAAEYARELGLDVKTGILEDADYSAASFDCVTMWDVLEHVPDPTAHMLEVNRILVDGGLVVLGTPDLGHFRFRVGRENWRHLKPSEHIYYFDKSSITRLLNKTGFEVVQPPLIGGRSFPGSKQATLNCAVGRLIQPNDVMMVYGVKNAIEIS